GVDKEFAEAVVEQLKANPGKCVVVAGPRMPAAVHGLVADINRALGNVGKTVDYYTDSVDARPAHATALQELVARMNGGEVKTLAILGGNPVYDAPADAGFADALKKVTNKIHLAVHFDETSAQCSWHLSRAHSLETWGDVRTFDGTASLVQPIIEPLFDG